MLLTCTHVGPLVQGNSQAIQAHIIVIVYLKHVLRVILLLHHFPQRHGLVRQRVIMILFPTTANLSFF